jgi:hypothetical protein
MHHITCSVQGFVSDSIDTLSLFIPNKLINFSYRFLISTLTGDLQYFVDGLKSIADILINHDESASKDGDGDGISRTIAGLFNFAVSAETLLSSEELTQYEFATLVHAIFAGRSLAQVLIDIYQNHCFLSKYSSDEHLVQSMRLYDVLGNAKNCSTNNNKAMKVKMGAQIHKGMSQEERRKAQKKQLVKEAKDTDEMGPQETKALVFSKKREHTMASRGKCDSVCNHQETGVSQNDIVTPFSYCKTVM